MTLPRFIRTLVATSSLLAAVALLAAPASAQIDYDWVGTGTGITEQWDAVGPILWNDITTPATPAATAPGSALNGGALTDDVFIRNHRTGATSNGSSDQQVRLEVDAGTIDSLTIGGSPMFDGFRYNTIFQIRTNSGNLDVTNDVTLGGLAMDGTTERGGQLIFNSGDAQMTIGGDILSANGSSANRIFIDGGAGANLNLTGTIDSVGVKEIDLWINRSDGFTTVAGVTLNVDDFRVGTGNNADRNGRSYTLDGGRTINGNSMNIGFGEGGNATARTVDGTLSIGGASAGEIELSGTANIGFSNSTVGDRVVEGTINVNAGGELTTAAMRLGTMNDGSLAGSTSIGTLNLNTGNLGVNVGNLDVGRDLRGEGTININAGTLATTGRVYIGGDEVAGEDVGTKGTINVNTGGALTVGNSNLEVGRGGAGFLNVDGGTVTTTAGALVLGQTATAGVQTSTGTVVFENNATVNVRTTGNGDINFNAGGGSIVQGIVGVDSTAVSVGRTINMRDGGGAFSSNYTVNSGTLRTGTSNNSGDLNIGIANLNNGGAGSVATFNVNGGVVSTSDNISLATGNNTDLTFPGMATLNITAGTVNTGVDNGAGTNNGDLQMGNSENLTSSAALNMSGGALNIARDLNYRGGTGTDTVTISGSSSVAIVRHLDMNGGLAGSSNINKLILTGSAATFTVDGNVLLNNFAELTYNIDSGGAILIDANNANLTMANADLVFSFTGLTSAFDIGNIQLIAATGTQTGAFSTFGFGSDVGFLGGDGSTYKLQSDATGVFLEAVAVPEPSTLALLGLGCLALVARRRRR